MVTIRNKYLLGLAAWLNDQPLAGKQSNYRIAFINRLKEKIAEQEKDRQTLLKKYCDLDAQGLPKKNKKGYAIKKGEEDDLMKAYAKLMDKDVSVDCPDDERLTIKSIVVDTEYKFGPYPTDTQEQKAARVRQANDYAEWCKAFA